MAWSKPFYFPFTEPGLVTNFLWLFYYFVYFEHSGRMDCIFNVSQEECSYSVSVADFTVLFLQECVCNFLKTLLYWISFGLFDRFETSVWHFSSFSFPNLRVSLRILICLCVYCLLFPWGPCCSKNQNGKLDIIIILHNIICIPWKLNRCVPATGSRDVPLSPLPYTA